MDYNPYASPETPADARVAPKESESIRQTHIEHEASIKSVGTLYLLGGILVGVIGATNEVMYSPTKLSRLPASVAPGIAFSILLSGVQCIIAVGLWRLKPWARWLSVLVSVCGLFFIPVGTLIGIYLLYLMLSEKGQVVFSPGYKGVIAETPHIKHRTSCVVIVLACFLVLMLSLIVLSEILG